MTRILRFAYVIVLLICSNVGCEPPKPTQREAAYDLGYEAYNIGVEAGDNPYARSEYAFLAPHWQAGWIEAKRKEN